VTSDRLGRFANELLRGSVPDCRPDELDEVVEDLVGRLANPGGTKAAEVWKALGALNNARLYPPTRKLAEGWKRSGRGFDPTVEKRLAQALIELGDFDGAEVLLASAIPQAMMLDNQAKAELGEYQGQLGRIAKQRFVQSGSPDELARSIELYATRYREHGKTYFHGINVVALVAAQQQLGFAAPDDLRLPALAEAVLADVTKKMAEGDASQWPLATASEAHLALNHCDEAELWLHRFLLHPETHPFHIESYSRQLREIWLGNALRNTTCADRLSNIVDRHVMRTQDRWSMSPQMLRTAQTNPTALEKNFSGERTFTVDTIKRMLEKCAGIGCVTDRSGRRLGTGFITTADTFGLGTADEWVFVTNAHVIGESIKDAIPPGEAFVMFELECALEEKPISHRVAPPVLFSSPPGEPGITAANKLDVTVVKLETWPKNGIALRTNDNLPIPSRKTKVFVVGHPSGGALQISLHDSELLDVCDDDRLLHYRTPTEPGSSGSPVFNLSWEVVALHHAGSPEMPRLRGKGHYEANEGISIHAIRTAVPPLTTSAGPVAS
jgi:hypothetical protein